MAPPSTPFVFLGFDISLFSHPPARRAFIHFFSSLSHEASSQSPHQFSMSFSFTAPGFSAADMAKETHDMSPAEREQVLQDMGQVVSPGGAAVPQPQQDDVTLDMIREFEQVLEQIPQDEKQEFLQATQACPDVVKTESHPARFIRYEEGNIQVCVKCTTICCVQWGSHTSFCAAQMGACR